MYQQIEQIIVRTLSPFEYERLEDLLKTYSQDLIVSVYKKVGDKPINYIAKCLKNKKKTPNWLNTEIINQELDEPTKKDFEDFKDFLEEFRNEKIYKKTEDEN